MTKNELEQQLIAMFRQCNNINKAIDDMHQVLTDELEVLEVKLEKLARDYDVDLEKLFKKVFEEEK